MKAVQKAPGDQPDQIVVALVVFGKEHKVVPHPGDIRLPITMIAGNVDLAADDRLDPVRFAGGIKSCRPVKIAVIGDRGRRHAEILGTCAKILEADGAVKQAVFGVAMQMNKFGHGGLGEKRTAK